MVRLRVAVLGGGRSPEHEVSLRSQAEAERHLDRERFDVTSVHLARDGSWHLNGRRLTPCRALDELIEDGIDVFVPMLHGRFGEDGTVQGMLELHDLAFVGAGCAASAVAMDKLRTRECLLAAGVPMPAAYVPELDLRAADPRDEAARIAASVAFPCFVKVDVSGSTLGVSLARDADDVVRFFADNREKGRRFLAEALVEGEEISVPVLGNSGCDPRALPAIGIYPTEDDHFSYDAKYHASKCEEVVPPRGLDADQLAEVERLAVRCHERLGCDGMSRTDMIVGADGPVVLEVNTIPGMTRESLLPKSAAAAGLSFSALLERLIELAIETKELR